MIYQKTDLWTSITDKRNTIFRLRIIFIFEYFLENSPNSTLSFIDGFFFNRTTTVRGPSWTVHGILLLRGLTTTDLVFQSSPWRLIFVILYRLAWNPDSGCNLAILKTIWMTWSDNIKLPAKCEYFNIYSKAWFYLKISSRNNKFYSVLWIEFSLTVDLRLKSWLNTPYASTWRIWIFLWRVPMEVTTMIYSITHLINTQMIYCIDKFTLFKHPVW